MEIFNVFILFFEQGNSFVEFLEKCDFFLFFNFEVLLSFFFPFFPKPFLMFGRLFLSKTTACFDVAY